MSDKKPDAVFDGMPGAEQDSELQDDRLDFNALDAMAETPESDEAEVTQAELEEPEAKEAEVEEEAEAEEEAEEELPVAAELEEEEPEVEEPVAEEKPATKPMVPKARLDEVLAKQKALQQQLDAINAAKEAEETAPETYEFDEKELEYQTLVLDGETDKAVALRREIRAAEKTQIEHDMRKEMSETVQNDRQMTALQTAANAVAETYPTFNPNAPEFNETLTNEVVTLRNAFITNGENAVDALGKAVKFVVMENNLDAPADTEAPTKTVKKPVDEVAKKRAQVNKKLKAAESQPPALPGESGANHGEKQYDLNAMTEEEFNALPESTMKRLRGDIV